MPKFQWKHIVTVAPVVLLASAAPNAFPAAQKGYASLHDLALYMILPAAGLLFCIAALSFWKGAGHLGRCIATGAVAGTVATLALEAVRYPGFRLGFMPGNLPELMGVLLLDQFAEGPSTVSTLAGFAYHFWNGACFGIIFAAMAEVGLVRRNPIWAVGYGILIALGFLASPVVQSLGVGFFGMEFGWRFAATVLTAHAAFGLALGGLFRLQESCFRSAHLAEA